LCSAAKTRKLRIANISSFAVTFKDLRKRVFLDTTGQHRLFVRLRNKPFWIWDSEEHRAEDIRTKGDCCFNHVIGLPTKERGKKPIFDYQKILYDALHIPTTVDSQRRYPCT
jgi:hypothetical protein